MSYSDKQTRLSNRILIIVLIALALTLIVKWTNAQNVGINSSGASPDASAILDISSTDKGLLAPRVALTSNGSASPVTSPATSLLVYNTATAGDVTPGYYYWDSAKWVRLINQANASGGDWSHTGNGGTTPGTHFLGTTDAQDLAFNTNNTERIRILANGRVDIGAKPTIIPRYELNVTTGTSHTGIRVDDNTAFSAGVGGGIAFGGAYDGSGSFTTYAGIWGEKANSGAGNTAGKLVMVGRKSGLAIQNALTIDENGNIGIATSTFGANAQTVLAIVNGVAPTSSIANGIQLYAQDVSASSELRVRDEAGNMTTLSPHNFEGIPGGKSEELAWAFYSTREGKSINVDMAKLARTVEKLSAENLVYIKDENTGEIQTANLENELTKAELVHKIEKQEDQILQLQKELQAIRKELRKK